jgi:predicted MPP superfamily phosphohydrolase
MGDAEASAELVRQLQPRLGALHVRQRLALERDHHVEVLAPGRKFFHLENWYSVHGLIRGCVRLAGLYGRARRNAIAPQLRHNEVALARLPAAFDGLRLLHLSDLHLDMCRDNLHALCAAVRTLDYDLCVMTGDYRARTFGDSGPALDGMAALRLHLKEPVYAVLGNHDSLAMVPAIEALGIRLLMNESVPIERDGERLFLAGVDDAHYFRVDNLARALEAVPSDAATLLLSHTPEIWRQAAAAGVDLFLCGHTHGGQICLPGGIPLTLDARCPRRLGRGPWRWGAMSGYTSAGAGTSIVSLRLNCPPEITLHTLRCG